MYEPSNHDADDRFEQRTAGPWEGGGGSAWVTPLLVGANVVVFAIMVLSGVGLLAPRVADLIEWGANFGPRTTGGEWWRLASSMFIHIGLIHVAFNMWVMWNVGQLVERLMGSSALVVLYILSGLAGSVASVFWNPMVVSAGASGAIFGVVGALMGFLLRNRHSIPIEVVSGLRNSLLVFLGYNLVFGIAVPGIDMAAHIGGLVAGFFCGVGLADPYAGTPWLARTMRTLLVAVIGTAVLGLAIYELPKDITDVREELAYFSRVEREAVARLNAAVGKLRDGEITEDQLADVLQDEVLPPWREMKQRLVERIEQAPAVEPRLRSTLLEYIEAREEAWQLQLEAVREQDGEKATRAQQHAERANRLAEEISQLLAD